MRSIVIAAVFLVMNAASASSPDAWDALYRSTSNACLQKSELNHPEVIEGPTTFAHAILYKIKGTWPQPHMKDKTGRVYCLHPYPAGEPEIVAPPD